MGWSDTFLCVLLLFMYTICKSFSPCLHFHSVFVLFHLSLCCFAVLSSLLLSACFLLPTAVSVFASHCCLLCSLSSALVSLGTVVSALFHPWLPLSPLTAAHNNVLMEPGLSMLVSVCRRFVCLQEQVSICLRMASLLQHKSDMLGGTYPELRLKQALARKRS